MSNSLPDVNAVVRTAGTYAKDLAERTIWSFLGGTVAVVVAAGPADMLHASLWKAAGVGGLTAAVSLVKGLVARGMGAKNSASTAPGV